MNEEEQERIRNQPRISNVSQIIQSLLLGPQRKRSEDEEKESNLRALNIQQIARPSEYMRQMSMTTEERMEYILKFKYKQDLSNFCESLDQGFQVTPSASRYLKTSYERDPFFSVEYRGSYYSMMIAPGLSNSYNVRFIPEELTDYEYRLKFVTNTGEIIVPVIGEKLGIDVRCSAQNCPIRVDRSSIRMKETYLELSRSKTLTIHNRSDYIVNYKWMLYKDMDTDIQRREQYKQLFQSVYEMELVRSVDLVHYDVCTPDIHQLVYQRIYGDEIESLKKETFRYNHMCFMLTPEKYLIELQEGEIWPQSSTDVTVLFRAMEAGEVTSTAFLEVTGLENRIPLSLYGTARGPFFRLNVISIDLVNIYLCSVHNYEVIVANKGHIPGTLIYKATPTDFGGTIEVTPPSLSLNPDEHKSFNLTFSTNRKGNFVERVDFIVKESFEILSLHIKGCAICPTLHFDKEVLDFGTTALGFDSRREVRLHNLSLVPVAFSITVQNDGHQTPLTHVEFARAQTKPRFPTDPREFVVTPETGVVSAQEFLKIKVIYTANIARVGNTTLQVDMWDSDSDPMILPIKFCGSVASISISPPEIVDRSCFINFPCLQSFDVVNASDLDGYFYLLPQPVSEDSPVVYSLSMHQGLIRAHQSKTIDVTIITRSLSTETVTLSMLIMGEESPYAACIITYTGQGPIVSTEPTALDFDEVQVLEEQVMDFLLINDSPISAHFKASMKRSPWSVSPESGDLEPHESIKIDVKLYLRDVGKYNDRVMLFIINSQTISVHLRTIGVGCSVVFEPRIFPVYDWGLLFSHEKINRTITLKNYGSYQYQIIWSTKQDIQINRGQVVLAHSSKFQIQPLILEVPPGETKVVQCELLWEENESLLEDWYVFGQIQGIGKRELIGTSTFKVTLTEPQVSFSKKELLFIVNICPDGDKMQQTDKLLVTNRSKLNLNVQLSVQPPFRLLTNANEHVQSMRIVLIDGATTTIRVYFSFDIEGNDLYSRSYVETIRFEYDEHPNQDRIECKGFVNFPNLVLDPRDFTVNCELGSSAEKILTLTNNGPVSVVYKFQWLEDSIEIERDTHSNCECMLQSSRHEELVISNVSEPAATNEDICISDRQDGSGDGPLESIPPPTNSLASVTQIQNDQAENGMDDTEENLKTKNCTASNKEIREFLMPLIGKYFNEEKDLAALEMLSSEPRKDHFINEVLDIVPNEGTVPPYTIQHVHIGFHSFEPLRVKATAICDIFRGPAEEIKIFARGDAIQFSIDTHVIDFGQQLFLESSRRNFVLKNKSKIAFEYKVIGSVSTTEDAIDRFDINPLKVEPRAGFVDAQSFVEFHVEQRSTMLGPIDHQFQLEIGHLMPVTITVNAFGTFPQVYPCISKGNAHSIELEYSAIQSLTAEFITDSLPLECDAFAKKDDLGMVDIEILTAEEWSIVSSDELLPRTMDIEMAVERHLAKRFVDSNSFILMQCSGTRKKEPIPRLLSSEYVIDMGYLIVEFSSYYSTVVINYGPWNVEMRMKKLAKKNALAKSGISVQFKNHVNLMVGNCAILQVTWSPSREKYKERVTHIVHTTFIEVIHGCTIPITIKGTVTYPFVTVNTKFLNFSEVVVGECLVMCILIKNE
ncbi:hydrocephalus-inducing protein homolog [Colletes gigas]|uniref:hydrocephalus-inducing protein homolog n=1 Tax=Colletes gigas TaxID=935657 RepID=UPI001C9B25E8|nr:hydrocephalus-inducing protein homolog [Colletes gigas]